MAVEERLARLEGVVEQLDKRLNHIESELGELRNELRGLRADLDSRFRWLLGVQITMWVTIMLAILLA